jgi:hypothetical protein
LGCIGTKSSKWSGDGGRDFTQKEKDKKERKRQERKKKTREKTLRETRGEHRAPGVSLLVAP